MDKSEKRRCGMINSGLDIWYDEKRCGYFVTGSGFDFFAYLTDDGDGNNFIECDHVVRQGYDQAVPIVVAFGGAKNLSLDIVETAILIELKKYWK